MSRKNKLKRVEALMLDTGGLDLAKFDQPPVAAAPTPAPPARPGLTLLQALSLSPHSRMAARPIANIFQAVLVANGRRFWVANAQTLEPWMMPFDGSPLIEQELWRPIVGDERGLRIE